LSAAALLVVALAAAEPPDVAAARAVFERNLEAIRRRDRATYLAQYAQAPTLARTGPEGPALGYEGLAAGAGDGWPDTFEARDLQLVPVRPGVVYGTYRYRVRYGADERAGLSERLFLETDAGWKIAVTTAFDAPPGTPPAPLALVGATLVDGTGGAPIPEATVIVRGGRVDCAGPRASCPVPAGVGVVDVAGKWVTPGLVDAHVHFSQTGWADGRPDAIDVRETHPYEKTQADLRAHPERFFRSYLCSGVTAVFDVGGYPWTIGLREATEADTRAPRVSAAGPLLSTRDHWLNLPAERQFIHLKDEESGRGGVRYLAAHGADAVKVWFIVGADEKAADFAPFVAAAGEEARKAGLPLIVHATGLEEAKAAVRAGASLLVHSVWDRPVDDEFVELLRRGKTVYTPTLVVAGGYVRLNESGATGAPPAVDDPNGCLDPATRARLAAASALAKGAARPEDVRARAARTAERERTSAENLKRVQAAGVVVAMGTDAGNPLTLHGPSVYAEMEAMQKAGLTPMQVLVASTQGGAQAMSRAADLGTVAKGKLADLLVLDADPTRDVAAFRKLRQVMRGGVLRGVEELHAVATAPDPRPAP
jgi:imidazolonepropionase-like amidohydrolase